MKNFAGRISGKVMMGRFLSVAAVAAALTLSGCATMQSGAHDRTAGVQGAGNDDPLEGYNRFMFKVNDTLDRAVLEPVARGYRSIVPRPARTATRNFLHNLRTPINAGNNLLQGDVRGFAADLSRFVINTMVGVGGLIDVAKDTGLDYRPEDFGQTLGVWGVPQGPYLVLPLLGPSTVRDTAGLLVDSYADPVRVYLFSTDREGWYYARSAVAAVDKREELLDAIDDLRRHSYDFYAATRSAYFQEREAMVNDKKPGQAAASAPAIPDYDEPRAKPHAAKAKAAVKASAPAKTPAKKK